MEIVSNVGEKRDRKEHIKLIVVVTLEILLEKLEYCGIWESTKQLIKSYMVNRNPQIV